MTSQRLPAFLLGVLLSVTSAATAAEVAYFSFVSTAGQVFDGRTLPMPQLREFVFAVDDPATIATLRSIVNSDTHPDASSGRVIGHIATGRKWYNPHWPFHYVAGSVRMAGAATIEVCDATPYLIEEHLHQVGGALLPDAVWCPWSMRLIREVGVSLPQGLSP